MLIIIVTLKNSIDMHIIYTLTNRTYSVIRGIAFFLLGVALLFWPDSMLNLIVKIIAAFLIAIGLVSLYFNIRTDKEEEKEEAAGENRNPDIFRTFATLNVAIYLFFGLLIFIFPGFFVSILVFLFGAILLLLGIGQLVNLFISGRHISMPVYFYIVPAIITICGIILFFQPFTAKNVLTMFFGGCVAGYGIVEIISAWMLRKIKFSRSGKYINSDKAEDVSYEVISSETDTQ